jgi:hypothetical protein
VSRWDTGEEVLVDFLPVGLGDQPGRVSDALGIEWRGANILAGGRDVEEVDLVW